MAIRAVVFDLGGVVFDWNPDYLYRTLIPDDAERRWFLDHVCTGEWNHRQDAGRPLDEATRELVAAFPSHRAQIEAFYGQWHRMLGGTLPEGVALLEQLEAAGVPLFALTNWAVDTFTWTRRHYPLLERFIDIVVSGEEGVAKPDPAIYARMEARLRPHLPGILPRELVFIDDVERNVQAARDLGWHAIHHRSAADSAAALRSLGVPFGAAGWPQPG